MWNRTQVRPLRRPQSRPKLCPSSGATPFGGRLHHPCRPQRQYDGSSPQESLTSLSCPDCCIVNYFEPLHVLKLSLPHTSLWSLLSPNLTCHIFLSWGFKAPSNICTVNYLTELKPELICLQRTVNLGIGWACMWRSLGSSTAQSCRCDTVGQMQPRKDAPPELEHSYTVSISGLWWRAIV